MQTAIEECRRAEWMLLRSSAMKSYLRSHQVRKLQIGAGSNLLKNWLNTDVHPGCRAVVFLDARERFPFDGGTFDYVFSEHQIEHITYSEGLFMLRECYRVLKPGGRIRVATPNLEALIGLCTSHQSDLQRRYINWVIDKFVPGLNMYRESFVINEVFRGQGHKFIYDRATLQDALQNVGFVEVTCYAVGESDDTALRGIESHGKAAGDEDMNQFETMILEAKRPR